MYTSLKSAKVTLVMSYAFCGLLVLLMLFAKPILSWFAVGNIRTLYIVMISFYICCPAAWAALVSIIKLLKNILREEIFIEKNVSYLRLLSWCCAFVSVVCLVSGAMYFPLLVFAAGAGFMMLILRVLKSVMARATEIKNENELTI